MHEFRATVPLSAAVTESEAARLAEFLATITDDPIQILLPVRGPDGTTHISVKIGGPHS